MSVIGKKCFYKKISLYKKLKANYQIANLKIQNNSKISFSPFGWGELGVRDYEIILGGSLLVKPRMDHMQTWLQHFYT